MHALWDGLASPRPLPTRRRAEASHHYGDRPNGQGQVTPVRTGLVALASCDCVGVRPWWLSVLAVVVNDEHRHGCNQSQ